ncbi:hypothetical protein H5V43_06890 [Sphingobium fuliginis]|uniref:Phage tail fiber protein n=1 Tax=Sphingobium fuliginis (strain ATCC 27551) TaxID=336203 RepID=A0A7M2GL69_SPHSA|nr:hypothetical protein [Sphingobium fuliginis]QOT72832.1 hypothetical protein H5V43_06890 [Sphingobium fuliginis]
MTTVEANYQNAGQVSAAVNAAVSSEATARANGDTANANAITSLTGTVNGHTASLTTQSGAIATLQGRTSAFWQVDAVAGGRAQLKVYADANGGGGVDIVGDVRISGNLVVDGTISTGKITNQAVSKTNYAQLSAPGIDVPTNSEVALYTTTFVKDEGASDIEFECSLAMTATAFNLWMRIYVDGGVSWFRRLNVPGMGASTGSDFMSSRYRISGLSAGSHTISFRVFNNFPTGGQALNVGEGSNFQITEVKK